MEFEMKPYGVYIKLDAENRIIAINSDAFISSLEDWIKIDEGYGDKYHHAQGNYLENFIMTENGIYRYKYENNAIVERSQEELEADYVEPEITPSVEDRVKTLETQLAQYEIAYMEGVNEA